MAELLETGALAVLGHTGHTKDTCAFCTSPKTPTSEENDLEDKEDEDAEETAGLEEEGIAHKNSSKKLGAALAKVSDQLEDTVSVKGIEGKLPVHSAAHHLIPGNGSLKPSQLKSYLHTQGMAAKNIGYDVNNYENGSWLAGNYALRGKGGLPSWGPKGTKFLAKTKVSPDEYAFAAIEKLKCQFHDGHENYNIFVQGELDLLAKKMAKTKDLWCTEAQNKPAKPEDQQLFMLVNRLNTISRRLKTMVENPGRNWHSNVYTSAFSEKYIRRRIYGHP